MSKQGLLVLMMVIYVSYSFGMDHERNNNNGCHWVPVLSKTLWLSASALCLGYAYMHAFCWPNQVMASTGTLPPQCFPSHRASQLIELCHNNGFNDCEVVHGMEPVVEAGLGLLFCGVALCDHFCADVIPDIFEDDE